MLNWIQDDFFFLVAAFAVVVAFLIFIARRRLWEACRSLWSSLSSLWEIRYDNSRVVRRLPESPYDSTVIRAVEQVEFAAFVPRRITPYSNFVLDIWAYLPSDYPSIAKIANELSRDVNVGRKVGVPVSRGAILAIRVDIPFLRVIDPVDFVTWEGEPANTSYIVEVPASTRIGTYSGRALISSDGITIAKLAFVVSVAVNEDQEYMDYSLQRTSPKTAFASYASEDREEVLSRIHGMSKVARDLKVFVDVFSLRSGDNWQDKLMQEVPTKDTFFLFWSRCANRSLWVEREWRLALVARTLDYIDPVPLDDPEFCPPPQELEALHFSDTYLTYIQYQRHKDEIKKHLSEIDGTANHSDAGNRCVAGHSLEPNWVRCPYCGAERGSKAL